MNDRSRLILKTIVAIMVTATIFLWAGSALINGSLGRAIFPLILGLVIVIFFAVMLISGYRNVSGGYPLKDEMIKKRETLAAAYAFYISIYLWLGIGFAEDYISKSLQISLGILGMASVFALSYLYLVVKDRLK